MTGPLAGQAALVTGGASGIGRATCLALARRGAGVVPADLDAEGLAETCRAVKETAPDVTAAPFRVDVRDQAGVEAMIEHCLEQLGGLDVLVCSAGVLRSTGIPHTVADLSTAEWDTVLGTNLTGTFLANRAAVRHMIRRRRGQVVNVSSMSGLRGHAFDGAYCASKFGVIGLTEALAEEVRRHGVRVQAVLPDVVATPLWEQNGILPPPADALSAERVGELIAYLVCLPDDVVLVNPVLGRFGSGRR